MGFNMHGLAFKQSMMTLVGFSIVFATLFGVLSFKVQSELSTLLTEKGEEISLANVAIIENLFEKGKKLGDEYAEVLGKEMLSGKDLDDFLTQAVFDARQTLPQVLAVVVAYEPGMAPKAKWHQEVMRLAQYSGNEIKLMKGKDYFEKTWYKSTKNLQKGLWQEPFVGDFIKEPIAIYTAPIYQKDAYGNTVFAGVLCVDMSIAFLKETVASIPVSNSGYVVVLSANNTIIAHPKNEIVFKENLSDLSVGMGSQTVTEFEKTVQSMKKGLFMGTTAEGKEAVIYFKAMESNGWTFMIVWPAHEFMESQRSLEKMFAWMSAAGYVVMLLLIFVISTRVSRPLKELAVAANKMGQGDFDVAIPHLSGRDEIAQFGWAFLNMRTSLKEHMEKQKDLDRIESELDFAKDIQIGFLSMDEKEEGSEDPYHELTPFLLPAKEVGGDFYDFFKLDDGRLCVVVGDVSGKGVPAALFMMVSRIVLRTMAQNLKSVVETFERANYELAKRNRANMFVTVWMGIVDLKTGHVEFASAGHNPPVIRHKDGSAEFAKSKAGVVMAAMENSHYKMQTLELAPGDTLFLYTDGVTEATNEHNELFGNDRLLDALTHGGGKGTKEMCRFVKRQIDAFTRKASQFDDITMLAMEYKGGNGI
ncbi:SpoIIE family protein phosphatase [Fibrobacter sp. UWB7]|uniref:SpoIIE family protein phosphatase n=1 Tax=Fibrobacter sp. UWB7 TaxID=1896206 RepID=UPI000920648E|nr:SpoIIE family protein phosphatase [Fibrobacter sp. UWB7]SHM76728.1 sigma-B regulation protein RsbU (phosphoserine phosphatase) [Fibrobacter sp. UWB7]